MNRLRILAAAAVSLMLAAVMAAPAAAQGTVPFQFMNQKTANYAFLGSDCSKIVTFNSTGALSATIGAAGTSFFAGCFIDIKNLGTAAVTITPTTSTIDGAATKVLGPNASIRLVNNNSNYFSVPFLTPQTAMGSPNLAGAVGVDSTKSLSLGKLPGMLANTVNNATPAAWIAIPLTNGAVYYIPVWR